MVAGWKKACVRKQSVEAGSGRYVRHEYLGCGDGHYGQRLTARSGNHESWRRQRAVLVAGREVDCIYHATRAEIDGIRHTSCGDLAPSWWSSAGADAGF